VKSLSLLAAVPLLAIALAGCGSSPDRTSLAKKTVSDYWSDIGRMKLNQAYALLSPGVQNQMSQTTFDQNVVSLLKGTSGVSAKVYTAAVVGDCSLVSLGLISPAAPAPFNVHQHLYWIQGGWRITDSNGYVSRRAEKLTSCPTGT
jgi:hypothetical protein